MLVEPRSGRLRSLHQLDVRIMIHSFDLQARAELAARSLTALLDPQRDGLMYFLATWRAHPPRADHCLWDCGDGTGRHIQVGALHRPLARRDADVG